jgi:hypothetical protein
MLIGDNERTRRAVNAMTHAVERAAACASLALMALDNDRYDRAAQWYLEAEETLNEKKTSIKVTALAQVAAAAARLGHSSRAAALVDRILHDAPLTAPDVTDPTLDLPPSTWTVSDHDKTQAAKALARGGLTDAACAVSATISGVDGQENSLLDVTRAVARRNLDEAEQLARSASDVRYLSARLAAVAVIAGRNGDQSRADRLLAEIDETLAELPQDEWRRFTIMASAVAWADAGAIERAESMVHAEMLPSGDTVGALSVAFALVQRNEVERASRLVALAEEAARPAAAGVDERRLLRWVGVMADFEQFNRAEQLVRSFPSAEVRSAGLATIAEGLLANGAVDRAERTLHAITAPRAQRRPRLELLRVLLAQGDDERAVELARSAATPQHRAEALTLVAGTTRSPDLLDEVVAIAEDVTELEAHMAILLPALQTAANLGDRPRTTALWRGMRAAAAHTERQPKKIGGSLGFLGRLPRRLRTLTEIADLVDDRLRSSRFEDRPLQAVAGPGSLWRQRRDLPPHAELAYDLATHDWFDLVDKLVEVEPDALRAIVSELDRLGSRATFHLR